jgi:hypothetical protein
VKNKIADKLIELDLLNLDYQDTKQEFIAALDNAVGDYSRFLKPRNPEELYGQVKEILLSELHKVIVAKGPKSE